MSAMPVSTLDRVPVTESFPVETEASALPTVVLPADSVAVAMTDPLTRMVAGLERLAQLGLGVEILRDVVALDRERRAEEARTQFYLAFAKLQGELPAVMRSSKSDKHEYAGLDEIIGATRPVLARNGFSVRFATKWPTSTQLQIVCYLTHAGGHFETAEFHTPADQGVGRNAVQALGSAVTYGKRYTLCQILNIQTEDDDDGESAKNVGRSQTTAAASTSPAGYDEWKVKLEAAARLGLKSMEAFWKASPKEACVYLTMHDGGHGRFKQIARGVAK